MLELTDTDVVREWLKQALEHAALAGRTKADLARHCGVTAQAVNGWLKTGRIKKHNLERASSFFGHGPSFVHSGLQARERSPTQAPPAPPADFADSDEPTESDWQLLRDLKWIPQEERDAFRKNIHIRATAQRAHTQEIIERLNRKKDKT